MLYGNIGKNRFLGRVVKIYCHARYYGFHSDVNTIAFVNFLKNDLRTFTHLVPASELEAAQVLANDLAGLTRMYGPLTVCGIPRSKRESVYPVEKMGLKRAIRRAVLGNSMLSDGLDYIIRHTDTLCTHRSRWGYGGAGEAPRPGLLRDTCTLSPAIAGKNIVLVDDIYTPGVGIDEDGVQALFDAGAKNVILYTFGYTVKKYGCAA